jgi:uncharacterized repeat protein (TIGR04138 family)
MAFPDEDIPLEQIVHDLIEDDSRFKFDAYVLIFESLHYAQKVMGMGGLDEGDAPSQDDPFDEEELDPFREAGKTSEKKERHITGQDLCEAVRSYALSQYGYMAKCVLNSWGLERTGDFGEIVYKLIGVGRMRKTDADCREDFDDVFDFETGFVKDFKITMPDS